MGDPLVRRQRPVVMDAFIQFDRLPSGPVRSCFRTNVPDQKAPWQVSVLGEMLCILAPQCEKPENSQPNSAT
jgi:hypothetical protein